MGCVMLLTMLYEAGYKVGTLIGGVRLNSGKSGFHCYLY
jgi:hypothetical protein